MSKKKIQKNIPSLYILIKELRPLVPDYSDFGLLLGYSVVQGLINFSTKVGKSAEEEKHFWEIKAVYSAFSNTLYSVQQQGNNETLSGLTSNVEVEIAGILSKNLIKSHQSDLFKDIFVSLCLRKDYRDRLMKKGLTLEEQVKRNGVFSRTIDTLTQDYELVRKIFAEKHYEEGYR